VEKRKISKRKPTDPAPRQEKQIAHPRGIKGKSPKPVKIEWRVIWIGVGIFLLMIAIIFPWRLLLFLFYSALKFLFG
jgi:hypothetical protein